MTVFLLFYLTIYGGVNLFFLWEMRRAFRLSGVSIWILTSFLIFMVLGPIVVRYLEHGGMIAVAKLMAYVVYSWMALAFWFFMIGLIRDLWNTLIWIIARFLPIASKIAIPIYGSTSVFLILILLAGMWSLREAHHIRLERVTIQTGSLLPGSPPMTVCQISDVHLGLLVGEWRLRQIIDLVNQAHPDMIVMTGDLVDGTTGHMNHLADLMASLHAPLGKFAITGNHEFYAGIKPSLAFIKSAGFRILRGESIAINERVLVVGVDDSGASVSDESPTTSENQILPSMNPRPLTLLLKHRPLINPASLGRFDLQISGHTHRGQIFPFNFFVQMSFPMIDGLYPLAKGSLLYTSRGAGTWGTSDEVDVAPDRDSFHHRSGPGEKRR